MSLSILNIIITLSYHFHSYTHLQMLSLNCWFMGVNGLTTLPLRMIEVVRVLKPGGKNEMVHELKFYTDIETISLLILSSRLLEASILQIPDREDGGVWRGGGLYSQLFGLLQNLSVSVYSNQSHKVGGSWQTIVDHTAAVLLRQLHFSLL